MMGLAMNVCSGFLFACFVLAQSTNISSFTYSSFSIPPTRLHHYDWTYITIDLPSFYSSMSIELESDVNNERVDGYPESKLPIICFRDGNLPLPDGPDAALKVSVSTSLFNGSSGSIVYIQDVEQCHLLQKKIKFILQYGQKINSEVLYAGLFNGIGPLRSQSKMINRGDTHTFSANVTVEACSDLTMWGQYCNQTVDTFSCAEHDDYESRGQVVGGKVVCKNSSGASCHGIMEPKFYSFSVTQVENQMTVTAASIRFDQGNATNRTWDSSEVLLICYARYGALPTASLHDHSADISKDSLHVPAPKIGKWYFTVQPVNQLNALNPTELNQSRVCYSLEWTLRGCPQGKAGPNCMWEAYKVQELYAESPGAPPVVFRDGSPLGLHDFDLESRLRNCSYRNGTSASWTYFLLDVPDRAAAGNINIKLSRETKESYELYARFGGLPSLNMWDYAYSNQRGRSNADSMFKMYDSSKDTSYFYIIYAQRGPWVIGLRRPKSMQSPSSSPATVSISVESCPNQCGAHGTCRYEEDANKSSDFSYCSCDRTHGGFDCSVRTVSQEVQRWDSACLIASNAAALLPAFVALREKAFADWVIFICSGISSAIYHACDVGTGCVLPFHVLQFMDFWLSFMAVVCTFVYLTTVSEAAKRTIQAIASILTALMAVTNATSFGNIGLVMGIGATALLLGWLIEFCSRHKSHSFSSRWGRSIFTQCRNAEMQLPCIMKTLHRRFRWPFMLLGFIALTLAAVSWELETTQSYWIWHSTWHVSIYTCSFFFLCSKRATQVGNDQVESHRAPPDAATESSLALCEHW